eukprot:GSChrysophyteH1.ASY1.ANO1.1761.1 assembled CDS
MGNELSSQALSFNERDPPFWLLRLLNFNDPRDMRTLLSLNSKFSRLIYHEPFIRAMCFTLRHHGIYVPSELPLSERGGWKGLYIELKPLIKSWAAKEVEEDLLVQQKTSQKASTARFKVNVYARFRPEDKQNSSLDRDCEIDENTPSSTERARQCVLPLHQRINLMKMSGIAKTRREALRVLASEGEWFKKKWQQQQQQQQQQQRHGGHEDGSSSNSNPKPMVSRVQNIDTDRSSVVMVAPDVGLREFSFDGVVEGAGNPKRQASCYSLMCKRLVVDFLNGYNATCVAYGQTAGGKTYTMMGPSQLDRPEGLSMSSAGIIPRACMEVLSRIAEMKEQKHASLNAELSISYIEIYGDYVCDLLKGGARVGHSKVASQRFVLSGAVETPVNTLDDIYKALSVGDDARRRAATAMNDRSSRAHALVILTLKQTDSKVTAGASRVNDTNAEFSAGFQLGDRMREAVYINLGLLALKRCIEALNESSCYVPYQDSKLTMLLSSGLGGDCKTSIILCNSCDPSHAVETMSTLRFGERSSVLLKLDADIASLELLIKNKERWEHKDVIREDTNAEKGTFEAMGMGGKETKKVSYLTGAEKERKELAALLLRRHAFVGSGEKETSVMPVVMGFGKENAQKYGLGEAFDEEEDATAKNKRFSAEIDSNELSKVVQKKGAKAWTRTEDLEHDPKKLEKLARTAKRSKLVYSGISA